MSLSSGSATATGRAFFRIVYRDNAILVVEKPAGIPTQPLGVGAGFPRPGRGDRAPTTLASLLAEQYPELKTVGGSDRGAVHRLDRETSGLVVFARTQSAYEFLRGEFSKAQVEKEYAAIVEGRITRKGRINWPIGPDPKSAKRVRVYKNVREARRNRAQEALTTYTPLSDHRGEGPGVRRTLLRILIRTGRRHQIRAHLAAIGHPIVGDRLYGGPEATRLHLHASRIQFRHPTTNRFLEVASPFSEGSPRAP